jgi:predicted acyl esterase
MEVTGRLIVKLWASSTALDTDFTSSDFPAGVSLNIADSIVRARYRNSLEKAEPLVLNQPYEFTIEMYPTSSNSDEAIASDWTFRAAISRGST